MNDDLTVIGEMLSDITYTSFQIVKADPCGNEKGETVIDSCSSFPNLTNGSCAGVGDLRLE